MNREFYPLPASTALALLLGGLLSACGGEGAAPAAAASHAEVPAPLDSSQESDSAPGFPPPGPFQPFRAPKDGDLWPDFVHHLISTSRKGLHFTLERFDGAGPEVAALLVPEIRSRLHDPQAWTALHNLIQALRRTGAREQGDLLLEILREAATPVVRSAAADALGELGTPAQVPGMIAVFGQDTQIAPRIRIIQALGKIGGERAARFLEHQFRAWLATSPASGNYGNALWASLLELEDAQAASRLAALDALLPRPFHAQALRRRAELGERGLEEPLRALLDPETTPNAQTRTFALEGLTFLADWEGVLRATEDPVPSVVRSAIQALRHPKAVAVDAGRGRLVELAQSTDPNLATAALQALIDRGDRSMLEPWLQRAAGYPTAPGSVTAIRFLRNRQIADPRTLPILLNCWRNCDPSEKIDLLRVFGMMADERAVPLMNRTLGDSSLPPPLRAMAATQLGNLGPAGTRGLLQTLDQDPPLEVGTAIVDALARLAEEDPVARERLRALPGDRAAPDAIRRQAIDDLPLALGLDAYGPLLAARDGARRSDVRAYLDAILRRYF